MPLFNFNLWHYFRHKLTLLIMFLLWITISLSQIVYSDNVVVYDIKGFDYKVLDNSIVLHLYYCPELTNSSVIFLFNNLTYNFSFYSCDLLAFNLPKREFYLLKVKECNNEFCISKEKELYFKIPKDRITELIDYFKFNYSCNELKCNYSVSVKMKKKDSYLLETNYGIYSFSDNITIEESLIRNNDTKAYLKLIYDNQTYYKIIPLYYVKENEEIVDNETTLIIEETENLDMKTKILIILIATLLLIYLFYDYIKDKKKR